MRYQLSHDDHQHFMLKLLSYITYHRLGFGSRIGHWGGRLWVSGLSVSRQIYLCLIYQSGICSTLRSWFQILLKNLLLWRICPHSTCLSPCLPHIFTSSSSQHTQTHHIVMTTNTGLSHITMHYFVLMVVLFRGSHFRNANTEKR